MPSGVDMRLEGDSNDYLGKGLSGGRIVLHPHRDSPFVAEDNVIAGNVIGYGATGGEIFIRGMVGDKTPVDDAGNPYGVFTWQAPAGLWERLSDLFAGVRP